VAELFVWQKNLLHALQTRPIVILHGNVRDQYVFSSPPHHHEIGLDELLVRLASPLFGNIRRYDAYSKAANLSLAPADVLLTEPLEEFGAPGFTNTLEPTIARILAALENRSQPGFWLLKYAHNILPYRNAYSQEEGLRLIAFQRLIENIAPANRLILVYLSDTQVPLELSQNAHRVAFVKVPLPDFPERKALWTHRGLTAEMASDLAKFTDGMALTSLQTLAQTAADEAQRQRREMTALTQRDWERAVARYKFGEARDFYQQITPKQLAEAPRFFIEQEGIQGQNEPVRKAIQMLWLARTNVASLLRSGPSNAPRGVLFCCGPSGTGKTMLGKKLAKFVFGSEEAFLRVDMSELQHDHDVSKLIGAPPGYVGYEHGGVLTNAILERPFQVVLFDEIEKGHPRIFDLFLQMLSDGRLTDSHSQTVYFSEAIILFTSNIGTRASEIAQLEEARQSGDPERVRAHFVRCVRNFFRYEISRPELLNRIGNNIVPFNFLEQEEVLSGAVRFYLTSMEARFNQEYAERNMCMRVDTDAVSAYLAREYGPSIREFGGRAVLNTLEEVVLPAVARRLLELEENPPKSMVTLRVNVTQQGPTKKVAVHV
jgi:ATP-dependent Clp protease ATP-binding subunit ClpA